MSLIEELKRRNVIRVAALYLVASWILLQLTDVLSSLLPVPPWTGSLVFLLLTLAFFPVVIFAWVYEMTPEGLKREADVDRSLSVTSGTGHKINAAIIVLLVLAIGGMVADRLVPEDSADTEIATSDPVEILPAADEKSIAVLPFADLSADQDQQYFTDGLSEELLNLLASVDDLRVASRTSSFAYRGSNLNVPAIARELNVGHVLEGSVRKDGDNIRITAQLIEAETDRHLWSENFDRKLVDIFAIQDEIGNAIVSALKGEMGITENSKAITVVPTTENLDAYDRYLKARELFNNRERLTESIQLFREAVALDPEFARAWEGLAAVEAVANDWIYDDGIDHDPSAIIAAEKALLLNPDLSMPFAVLGRLAMKYDRNASAALELYASAIKNDPRNMTAWLWKGLALKQLGFVKDSIFDFEKCLEIDPGYQNCRQHMADAYLILGGMEMAMSLLDVTLEHNFHSISESFVSTFVRLGQRNLALTIADIKTRRDGAPVIEWIRAIENPGADNSAGLARLVEWSRQSKTGITLGALPHSLLSFQAYDELAKTPREVRWVSWHPDAAEFRQTPQFKPLMRETGVLEYWQNHSFPPQCRPVGSDDFECD